MLFSALTQKNIALLNQTALIGLSSKQYSPRFFSYYFPLLFQKKILYSMPRFLSIELSFLEFESVLSQSMIGMNEIFNLGDISSYSGETKYKKHIAFIASYKGPHRLIFFIEEKKAHQFSSLPFITFPSSVDELSFKNVLSLFGKEHVLSKMNMVQSLFAPALSLESALKLIDYLELTSLSLKKEFENHLHVLVENDVSLFLLSQLFFTRKSNEFFKEWNRIEAVYPPLFWISYWSDQIWRAYFVIFFLMHNNAVQARTMSVRLPFAFIKSLWKNVTLDEMEKAYSFLYELDNRLKNGATINSYSLELLFVRFFEKKL